MTPPLFDSRIERMLVAAVIADPTRLDTLELAAADLQDFHARAALGAVVKVYARNHTPTAAVVRAELAGAGMEAAVSGLRADPDRGWFDELVAIPLPRDPPISGWMHSILRLKARRDEQVAACNAPLPPPDGIPPPSDDDPPHAVDVNVQIGRSSFTPEVSAAKPMWRRCSEFVGTIWERRNEPWISLRLGADELVKVRAGGIAVIMGPTGSGKSSLVAGILIAHARDTGPVVVLSRELPGDEFTARMIGMQCDASWPDVLTGNVLLAEMERVTSSRVVVLEREHARLEGLEAAIVAMQAEYPDQPVLVAVDYLQIIESEERDARAKVSDVVARIDAIIRRYRVVTLAISQMSRAASRAAKNGEAMGADSTDGGAESAAIERAATVTLSIGASGPIREDGTCAVDLSIGKHRMGGGDKVITASYEGRTGRWRLAGEARPAVEVRAEREGQRDSALVEAAMRAMLAGAEAATEPLTRAQLGDMAIAAMRKCTRAVKDAAIARSLTSGKLALVQRKPQGARHWLIWTPAKATAAGILLVNGVQG